LKQISIGDDKLASAVVIAVAGGSCSGKTTLVEKVRNTIGEDSCTIVYQDDYYRPNLGNPVLVNFDHPDTLDFELMSKHISLLKQGQSIETPIYDFTTHSRTPNTKTLAPKPLIFVEGILVLNSREVRGWVDYGVFVGCDEDVRYARRSQRDTVERGRTPEDIERQFFTQVAPMHIEFVEPSSAHADLIISDSEEGLKSSDVDDFIARCEQLVTGRI
jgi:uridine kinase